MKRVDRSVAQRKDVEKAERALQGYRFLFWLDKFTQVRESKTNINQSDEESDRSDEDEDDERDDSMGTKSIQSGEEEDDSDGITDDDEIDNDEDNDEGITPLMLVRQAQRIRLCLLLRRKKRNLRDQPSLMKKRNRKIHQKGVRIRKPNILKKWKYI